MLNHNDNHNDKNGAYLTDDLDVIATLIRTSAQKRKGDCFALIALLKTIGGLHDEIRDGLFQDALPDNRQALYTLLRDLETQGGWPQVQSVRFQALLEKFIPEPSADEG